jgi:hypothetical protein
LPPERGRLGLKKGKIRHFANEVTMSREPKALTIPQELAGFFNRPPLLVTENLAEYDALFNAVAQAIVPADNIEWISMGKYVDSVWEARRLQGAKAAIINATYREALRTILESILPDTDDRFELAARLAEHWFEKPDERAATVDRLAKYNLDAEAVCAEAMALRAAEIEKIDRMLQQIEIAGMARLREIEFHRRAASWRSPRSLMQLVDATAEPITLPAPAEEERMGPTQ